MTEPIRWRMPPWLPGVRWLFALTAVGLFACSAPPPDSAEKRLRDTLASMQQAVENRDVSGLMAHVATDYRDEAGRSQQELQQLARFYFLRHRHPHVFVRIKSIAWQNPEKTAARVNLLAATAGQAIDSPDLLSSLRADLLQFDLLFETDANQRFLLESAQWQPAFAEDFF